MLKVLLSGLAVIILLSGCASGPAFNTVENSLAPAASNKARIFFYRSSSLGFAFQPEITLNGTVVGNAKPNGVFFVDRDPGNMVVVTSTEVEKKLTFTVEAGERRYVRTNASIGILTARIIPELVDENEAKEEISNLAYTSNPDTAK